MKSSCVCGSIEVPVSLFSLPLILADCLAEVRLYCNIKALMRRRRLYEQVFDVESFVYLLLWLHLDILNYRTYLKYGFSLSVKS